MKVHITSPVPPGSLRGNAVTAERWARFLGELGHAVRIEQSWTGEPADLLVALHARKSAPDVARWRAERGAEPLVVALTGTDLYVDLPAAAHGADEGGARAALGAADRIVALHPGAERELSPELADRLRVILQSVAPPAGGLRSPASERHPREILVPAHLRPVKDPLLAALAVRELPETSRLRVVGLGEALDTELLAAARAEQRNNPRYRFEGPLTRDETLRRMAGAAAVVLSSSAEGGANIVGEACVLGTPLLATRIPSTVGLVGDDWPGLFEVGDAQGLAALMERLEQDTDFDAELRAGARRLAPRFDPDREREAWRTLLAELS